MPFFMMLFSTQYCTSCKRPILVQLSGTISIGSPLVACRGCGQVHHTNLRREWYTFKHKVPALLWPFFLGCVLLLGALIPDNPGLGFVLFIGSIVGICLTLKNIIQMLLSKKRMGNPDYLSKLLHYGEIDHYQYQQFLKKCKK